MGSEAELSQKNKFLEGTEDRFGGIIVRTSKLTMEEHEDFENRLKASLNKWTKSGVRGVWIQIKKEHSILITICSKVGFDFHHAQPGYVLMNTWLIKEIPSTLPEYANQYLGAAGFVVNSKNQVLVIQERYHTNKIWKLPGGHADKGEDIGTAAVREVREETGVESEFVSILCFRHQHGYRHGLSDFYFICLLRPTSETIKKCDQEIHDARWMDLEDYEKDPTLTDLNKFVVNCYKEMQATGVSVQGIPVKKYVGDGHNFVYKAISSNHKL